MADFRRWRVEFEPGGGLEGGRKRAAAENPPGYEPGAGQELLRGAGQGKEVGRDLTGLKQGALYSRATGTVKQVGFMAFMMWMAGSQIHLFSIMMTVSGIYQPLMAIIKSDQAFPQEASEGGTLNVWLPRLIYCAVQAGGLAFGLYKLNTMGLLPTHASDYVSALKVPQHAEFSSQGVLL